MKSLALLLLPLAALAQNNDLHLMKVQGNVYMLVGPGGNMAVQAGKDGLVVVDSKTADQAKKIVDLMGASGFGAIRRPATSFSTRRNRQLPRDIGHRARRYFDRIN